MITVNGIGRNPAHNAKKASAATRKLISALRLISDRDEISFIIYSETLKVCKTNL